MFRRCLSSFSYAKTIMVSTRRCLRTGKDVPTQVISDVSHRTPPPCARPPYLDPARKPCFDINSVVVERCFKKNAHMVKMFLYSQFYNREPNFVSLGIALDSRYLELLTRLYTSTCDQWLAFRVEPRTGERTMIGLLVAKKQFPWDADECEKYAENFEGPEKIHMYLRAHCYRSPNLFEKFKVPFVYNIEVLVTRSGMGRQGVAEVLLSTAFLYALEMRYRLVQIIASNSYLDRVCKRANMKLVWSMQNMEYTDQWGRALLPARIPHTAVKVFVRQLAPRECSVPDETNAPLLFTVFKKQCQQKVYCETKDTGIYPPLPKCPTLENRH